MSNEIVFQILHHTRNCSDAQTLKQLCSKALWSPENVSNRLTICTATQYSKKHFKYFIYCEFCAATQCKKLNKQQWTDAEDFSRY